MKSLETGWRDGSFSKTVDCHALLYPDEISYLQWLGFHADPNQCIVDLGAFLGGSSLAFATGQEQNSGSGSRLIAYDSFVLDQLMALERVVPGIQGDSFIDVYRMNLSRYLNKITIREGFIPEYLAGKEGGQRVFPDQEPISVLFIDCAKTWGVHHTILNVFGPWLRSGSVVVQQDFRSTLLYIPIHMYQLRDTLSPVHSVDGGTLGFVANGPVSMKKTEGLWTPNCLQENGFDETVEEVGTWFDQNAPEPLSPWIWIAAAGDRAGEGDGEHAIACLDRAMTGISVLAGSIEDLDRWSLVRENWSGEVMRVSGLLQRSGCQSAAEIARRLGSWSGGSPSRKADSELLSERWRKVCSTCRDRGWSQIMLYGAGRHTQRLLAAGFPETPGVCLVGILDDSPERVGHKIASVPIIHPDDLPDSVEAILPSSDAYEAEMMDRCQEIARRYGIGTFRIYSA